MKTIDQNELYQHLCGFLKSKGIDLKEGSYPQRVRQGCGLLTEAINRTQQTASKAKVKVEKKLDLLRQCIHEATAPKGSPSMRKGASPPPPPPSRKPGERKAKSSQKATGVRARARRRK
jgi:hypothetical protein